MKAHTIGIFGFVVLSVLLFIISSGCLGQDQQLQARVRFYVMIVDSQGNIMTNSTFYYASYVEKPAVSGTGQVYEQLIQGSATTEKSGFATGLISFLCNVSNGDTVLVGVSTEKGLIESDFARKQFDNGNIGNWTRIKYSSLKGLADNFKGKDWLYEGWIYISKEDGKMNESLRKGKQVHFENFTYSFR